LSTPDSASDQKIRNAIDVLEASKVSQLVIDMPAYHFTGTPPAKALVFNNAGHAFDCFDGACAYPQGLLRIAAAQSS